MPMGDSGGRSAGNRTGENARRRNTPRERAQIDPPWDEVVPRYRLTPRGERLMNWFAWLSFAGMCVLGAIIIVAWWF